MNVSVAGEQDFSDEIKDWIKLIENSLSINGSSFCIAVPSPSGKLQWKMPSQCVWRDTEFSENGLQLRSKLAMQPLIEHHAPDTIPFFTNILKLPDAGIDELLEDLKMLQQESSDDAMLVFRLYERIQTHRRNGAASDKIRYVIIGKLDQSTQKRQKCFQRQPSGLPSKL
jgi:hypothetical protein